MMAKLGKPAAARYKTTPAAADLQSRGRTEVWAKL